MDDQHTEHAGPMDDDERAEFTAIVGERYALVDAVDIAPHLVERRGLYQGVTPLVLKPRTTAEVSRVLKLAHAKRRPVVPQGGNTGLVGGQIPFEQGNEIVLNLSRMDQVRAVDPVGNTMIAEAGVTLSRLQDEADRVERLFPLSLASEGTCQIGGNLATNAGGMQVLAYGNARHLCLGLEVVLADGRIWDGLRTLRKDNTGYDMRDLFIGSEGTIGVITAAALILAPRPAARATAFVGLNDLDQISRFFELVRSTSAGALTRFEILPRFGLELVLKHADDMRDPLEGPHPWYVIVEVSGAHDDGLAERQLMSVLERAAETAVVADATLAASQTQDDAFWAIRERLSEVQGLEGGSIKNDVAVPVADVPAFIRAATAKVAEVVPGSRPIPFGHFGDGNIHFNVSQPIDMDKDAFLARWDDVCGAVNEMVLGFGGTISAEHGIGRLKRHLLAEIKSPVEMEMMRAIKRTFDPLNILNPGKVV